MNIYLDPFVKECTDLHECGFYWVTSDGVHGTSKVYALILVILLPVYSYRTFKQFNGVFECSFCLRKGKVDQHGQEMPGFTHLMKTWNLDVKFRLLELVTSYYC